ncbi:MAG TPA: DUF6198 family protein [Methanocorpusculum sp.]|nr:DUF6198 family protein [Methanocorpusculum sp.]
MKKERLLLRCMIFLMGMFMVSLGIVLCKKSELGISPISTVPYVLEYIVPVSFGTLMMFFHMANTMIQMILSKKIKDWRLILQIPFAFIFGQTINVIQKYLVIDSQSIWVRCIALILSVLFTAGGMVCMLNMKLISNPPDGTVKKISEKTRMKFGNVKIFYDATMVVISILLGVVFCRKVVGVGVGTLVSAICVGKCVSGINSILDHCRIKFKR